MANVIVEKARGHINRTKRRQRRNYDTTNVSQEVRMLTMIFKNYYSLIIKLSRGEGGGGRGQLFLRTGLPFTPVPTHESRTYVRTYLPIYLPTYIHTQHTDIHNIHTYIHIYIHNLHTYVLTRTYIHTYIHTHIHTHTTYIHTIYIHTFICTYTTYKHT